jgi:hypothetical protein
MQTQAVLALLLGLGLLFGPDLYTATQGSSGAADVEQPGAPQEIDQGRSLGGRVHVAFCTS